MAFTNEQLERYSRHIILKEVGVKGQKKLLNAKVLIIGAGGLGATALTYGYQNFNQEIMYSICVILIILVAIIQYFGDWIYKKLK